MKFKLDEVCSLEALHIPLDSPKIHQSLPKYQADDQKIAKAEAELGFKLGSQTKEFFKKHSGLYFGGSEFMSDIDKAVGNTLETYDVDDRLKNKSVSVIFIASDGSGNNLYADANDNVGWYMHDSSPVFDTKSTRGMKLFAYIEWEYKYYNSVYTKPFVINPTKSVGDIKFGMKQNVVRETLDTTYRTFKKTDKVEVETDNFKYCHVFYNKNKEVVAVELFEECNVLYSGVKLFGRKQDIIAYIQGIDPLCKINKASVISKKLSIGISFDGTHVRSILVGNAGYYSTEASTESFNMELALEAYRDPSKIKDYEIEFIEGIAKLKVFGKECAPSIIIPVNKDGSIDTSTYNKFIVKAPSIIEAGVDQIVMAFESGWWQDVFPNKKATKSDFIKAFRYISEIDIKLDDDNKECVVVMLEGDSPMDEEHGIGVKIINNKVVKCGTGGYFGE